MKAPAPSAVTIDGTVAPGFEPVRELYEHNMRTLLEANTQLCVYVGGERVVDLWASAVGDAGFSPDSLVNVFSSSKNLEAVAMAWLVDRDLLDYGARVIRYWPEFGGAGKQSTTVADVMRHEAGLAALAASISPVDLLAENIKRNRIGAIIEQHPQRFRKGADSKREYHAVTRGWIVNEIFRRVDPAGRTIGEFIRAELAGPLDADVVVGVRDDEAGRIAKLTAPRYGRYLVESLKPKSLGRRYEWSFFDLCRLLADAAPMATHSLIGRKPAPPFRGLGLNGASMFNDPVVARGETPSANSHSSARGLAKVAGMLANRGRWQGRQILSDRAWQAMHAAPVRADMGFVTTFTQGGVAHFPATTANSTRMERRQIDGREGFYGWFGFGGSIFQWHPEYGIGFGYVPTSLFELDLVNERGKGYQAQVLRCLRRMR